jgi:transposase
MKLTTIGTEGFTMGIDMGDKWSHVVTLDNETGDVVEDMKLMTCEAAFRAEFGQRKPMRVAIEAGTHSPWASRLLEELGHEVLVANPRELRIIYKSDKKNDRNDAHSLARVARMDAELLGPIRHRGVEAHKHLALIRARDAVVRTRTALVNHVRGAVKSFGGRLPSSSTGAFPKLAQHIPKDLWEALSPVVNTIASMTKEIKQYDRAIARLANRDLGLELHRRPLRPREERYPETQVLQQVHGVGEVTSLAFVLTIEDPRRFESSRQVGAYLGLRPRQDLSGTTDRQLPITKAGDSYLRRLLVGSAQFTLGRFGEDCDLRRWGLQLAKRGGKNAKKRAAVAVARKLAVLLHRLWITGEAYEPLRNASRRARKATTSRA